MNYTGPIREQINAITHGMLAILPNLVIALCVVIITWLVSKFAVAIANKLTGRTRLSADLKALVETLVWLGIWIIGLLTAATIAIPGFTPAGLIAGLGIGAVAIGFAFQDILENFLAGVLIMLRDKMDIGDSIEAEGITGTVERITLRETHIRQFSGELTILPNSMIFKNPVKIFSDQADRRLELTVGISYDADIEQARAIMFDAVSSLDKVSARHPVVVWARTFNSSSIDFLIQWWVDSKQHDLSAAQQDAVFAIKKALDGAGIEIPLPHVTNTFKEALPILAGEETETPASTPTFPAAK